MAGAAGFLLGAFSLSKAREAAAAVMGDVAKERNPAAERKEAAAAEWAKRVRGRLTLAILIQDSARLHLAHRRPRYATKAVRALRHALAKHLERPAEDLDRAAVVHALDSLSRRRKAKGKDQVAPRNRHRWPHRRLWTSLLRSAIKRGTVPSNPFAELPLPTTINKRDRVLNDEEVTAIWRAAGEATHPFGAIVRLLMLTGQRREEVAGMTWAELSEDLATWTIPATRTKNGIPHLVPLSQPASKILQALRSDGPGDVQGATSARSWRSSSPASAERPLAAGRKRSQRSTPHPVFPAGGCMTCAGRSRQGCSASECASKSPRRC